MEKATGNRDIDYRFPPTSSGQDNGTPERVSRSPRMCVNAPTDTVNPTNHRPGPPFSSKAVYKPRNTAIITAVILRLRNGTHPFNERATVPASSEAIASTTRARPNGITDNTSAIGPWGADRLLQEEVSDFVEVFEGDLIRQRLTVAGGSVVVLSDASGFDLLLSVVVQQRISARPAAVEAVRTSWLEYQREIDDEIAAWQQEGTHG
ncbi:hypothetical protein [Nocardiopsis sp. JB363]|uniref:hypothetical protein n=1 Tax=Nocardiopsis sp. JB363 TaxID=1434837 RepID=UPI00117BF21A|nr:hypothetical protein [Nocardiopsis sp. JB363]